ncbi:MAG TPA: ribosome recycling factor [Candidatus Atribacteria bacterium]|jgi:ribosome recycling factor|uniref:ribosome recycling factor n=1 Tax=Candidatus Sordicultor fermentans TaxID=1953203 RepID=UPI00169A1100|nr:ribosome recycling factor [Atribacterota bacterium]NLY04731.1 ribosome recycling factor [Candidatus Atribacteria bacterium]MDI9607942.1 ribosome recycling factor [Atribacterota bacterium]MDY0134300.1 ribosome recycling factor [Atribacterota bacterium]HOA98424.1 ribosome recycling factor [Candidatus Atribacteria bacterium]
MNEDLKLVIKDVEKRMKQAINVAREELSRVRTGRASPALVEDLEIDYYGTIMKLKQIASITTPDARTIIIQPWDKNALSLIEKAIWKSDLGLNPQIEGGVIRIAIPPLTEERRKEIAKIAKKWIEEAKVAIRNLRREANEKIKKMEKRGEISEDESERAQAEVQKLTDEHINDLDGLWEKKEKEIMTI